MSLRLSKHIPAETGVQLLFVSGDAPGHLGFMRIRLVQRAYAVTSAEGMPGRRFGSLFSRVTSSRVLFVVVTGIKPPCGCFHNWVLTIANFAGSHSLPPPPWSGSRHACSKIHTLARVPRDLLRRASRQRGSGDGRLFLQVAMIRRPRSLPLPVRRSGRVRLHRALGITHLVPPGNKPRL